MYLSLRVAVNDVKRTGKLTSWPGRSMVTFVAAVVPKIKPFACVVNWYVNDTRDTHAVPLVYENVPLGLNVKVPGVRAIEHPELDSITRPEARVYSAPLRVVLFKSISVPLFTAGV